MVTKLIADIDSTHTQGDAHEPPAGAGTYDWPDSQNNNFVTIESNEILVEGDTTSAHGTATATASSFVTIEGNKMVRQDDAPSHHHPITSGIDVVNNSFVYSD